MTNVIILQSGNRDQLVYIWHPSALNGRWRFLLLLCLQLSSWLVVLLIKLLIWLQLRVCPRAPWTAKECVPQRGSPMFWGQYWPAACPSCRRPCSAGKVDPFPEPGSQFSKQQSLWDAFRSHHVNMAQPSQAPLT